MSPGDGLPVPVAFMRVHVGYGAPKIPATVPDVEFKMTLEVALWTT